MDLLPAVDIRGGRVVRLSQGEPTRETGYHHDPVTLAERFIAQGARWLHIVDLDRAFGDGDNSAIITRIVSQFGAQVQLQLSGGFRSLESIRSVLSLPVTRLVLGTAAITAPELISAAVAEAGERRIAVGLDARNGMVAIRGWAQTTDQRADDVARRVVAAGVRTIIYTDVSRDGMLSGPDIAGAVALQQWGAQVIASGGVARLSDIGAIRAAGLAGVIVGRALYEGRFTLAEAVQEAGRQGEGSGPG
ncbi:MAG: HisA/HisF-related TIM barrel protein [Gemmatimonadales bacterium]